MSFQPTGLGLSETLYVAGRVFIGAACLAMAGTAIARLFRPRAPALAEAGLHPATLAVAAALALSAAAVLSLRDAYDNTVLRAADPILPGSWYWLGFDLLLPLLGLLLMRALDERDLALVRLAEQAVTDPLTGLRNRRGFLDAGVAAITRAARDGVPVSVVALDLDRFKAVNDTHGHAAGDAVLRGAASAVLSGLRAGDLAGRLGGEEFALLLPGAGLRDASAMAERLRVALPVAVPHPTAGARVTASFGVAELDPVAEAGHAARVLEAAIAAADGALYVAKRGGRDRVALADRVPA
ncbi:GGDEF domain-containing protein [Falsiroseomonas oryziterrae]|uniref:GGDEF domain-containing protein n=1 Tax=Falsiroseomonas oryziterrae TaxID=2911368 RepID=UPI001F2CE399|nr:GGDEF domain-containing protein [Roseomonas sp. NPKOSM-4]